MNAYLGGGVIGLAVALLWLGIGRIAGVSGIVSRLNFMRGEHWRWGFVGGILPGRLPTSNTAKYLKLETNFTPLSYSTTRKLFLLLPVAETPDASIFASISVFILFSISTIFALIMLSRYKFHVILL